MVYQLVLNAGSRFNSSQALMFVSRVLRNLNFENALGRSAPQRNLR